MSRPVLPVDHVTILVGSLAESMPYYDRLLEAIGHRKLHDHVWVDSTGFHLQFREAEPGTRPYERYGAGVNHIGFAAPDPETVEGVRTVMEEAGFPTPSIQRLAGRAAIFMKDPDGLRFEITYTPPGLSIVD